jgi:glycolate oxidase
MTSTSLSRSPALQDLSSKLGRQVIVDPEAMTGHIRDQCLLAPAGQPVAVVRATCVDHVVATVEIASEHAVPVVTRGAGTGLSGAANAIDGAIVLDVSGMRQVLEVDPVARTARVEPGVLNGELDAVAKQHGLWYVPDPGSRAISSIGGNVATNAGGMCCAKYGVTGDHVLELTAVLADGQIIRTGGTTRKNVVGLDLTRLLVGSEGTLGVVVEVTVRLHARPRGTSTVAATFPSSIEAVALVSAMEDANLRAAAAELMDRTTVRAVNELVRMDLDEEAGALVLLVFDGPHAPDDADSCSTLAQTYGALEVAHTTNEAEGTAMMEARRMAYPALEAWGSTLLDDVAVPVHRLPEMLGHIDTASRELGVVIGTFGHVADGNLHPTIVFDPADRQAADLAADAFDRIVLAALDLGGTVSGEHGVGALKQAYVERQVGTAELALMHRVKAAFDPVGIFNPGRAY